MPVGGSRPSDRPRGPRIGGTNVARHATPRHASDGAQKLLALLTFVAVSVHPGDARADDYDDYCDSYSPQWGWGGRHTIAPGRLGPTRHPHDRGAHDAGGGEESLGLLEMFRSSPIRWSVLRLNLSRRMKKRLPVRCRQSLVVIPHLDAVWAVDFMGDTLLTSRAHLITVDRPGFGHSNFGNAEPSLEKQAAHAGLAADPKSAESR